MNSQCRGNVSLFILQIQLKLAGELVICDNGALHVVGQSGAKRSLS